MGMYIVRLIGRFSSEYVIPFCIQVYFQVAVDGLCLLTKIPHQGLSVRKGECRPLEFSNQKCELYARELCI